MRKSTLFLSAVLTAFVMVMLTGVVTTYQRNLSTNQPDGQPPATQAQTGSQASAVTGALPAQEVLPASWTPEQAAALAARVLGREDLFSVEVTDLNGETVFLVTFSSGDLVYVSLDGQVRSIGKVQVQTVVVKSGGGGDDDGGSPPPPPRREHDDDDDHQEDHKEKDDEHKD